MGTEDGFFTKLREALVNGSASEGSGALRLFAGHTSVAGDNHGVINITINQSHTIQHLTYRQRREIRRLVSHVVKAAAKAGAPVTFPQAYRRLHDEFGVDRYDDIPAASYPQARAFLLGLAA